MKRTIQIEMVVTFTDSDGVETKKNFGTSPIELHPCLVMRDAATTMAQQTCLEFMSELGRVIETLED